MHKNKFTSLESSRNHFSGTFHDCSFLGRGQVGNRTKVHKINQSTKSCLFKTACLFNVVLCVIDVSVSFSHRRTPNERDSPQSSSEGFFEVKETPSFRMFELSDQHPNFFKHTNGQNVELLKHNDIGMTPNISGVAQVVSSRLSTCYSNFKHSWIVGTSI